MSSTFSYFCPTTEHLPYHKCSSTPKLTHSINLKYMNIKYPVLITGLISCNGPDYSTIHYQAVSADTRDTALLELSTSKDHFYGKYQIRYNSATKDDGTLSGHVIGDTLSGKFTFLSRDNVKSVEPIVFLRQGKDLQLGTGTVGKYLGLRVYKYGSLVFTDSLFHFQPVSSK